MLSTVSRPLFFLTIFCCFQILCKIEGYRTLYYIQILLFIMHADIRTSRFKFKKNKL